MIYDNTSFSTQKIFFILGGYLFLLSFTAGCASSKKDAPSHVRFDPHPDSSLTIAHESAATPSILMRPFTSLLERHQNIETHYDGVSCPMYPSCSHYGKKALNRYSVFGFLFIVDRIFYREMFIEEKNYFYAPEKKSQHLRFYDPLEESVLGGEVRPSLLTEEGFRSKP